MILKKEKKEEEKKLYNSNHQSQDSDLVVLAPLMSLKRWSAVFSSTWYVGFSGDMPNFDGWESQGFSVIPNFGNAVLGATVFVDV